MDPKINRRIFLIVNIIVYLCVLFQTNLASASSRGRSISSSTTNKYLQMPNENSDFFFQFIKELAINNYGNVLELPPNLKKNETEDDSTIERHFYEWIPDGGLISAVPPECLPESFEKTVLTANLPASQFAKLTQDFFDRCGPSLSSQSTGGLWGLVDWAVASYPFEANSRIHSQNFVNKDGRSLQGFIGIKDQSPRPWIIYKCGVFCEGKPTEITMKNFMIHLFDQTPFNVIFLGNRTGDDYILKNKVFNIGGYFEYQDYIDIAGWLREESPYKNLVSSVHAVGVSLGGSAAFLTEKKLSTSIESKANLIQSVTSLCGVADLRPTIDNLFDDSIKGMIFSKLTWQRIQNAKPVLIEAEDLLTQEEQPNNEQFPILLGQLASRFMNLPNSQIENDTEAEKKFWEYSNYSEFKGKAQVPLLAWASEDDSIVNFGINTGNLINNLSEKFNPNFGAVRVPMGEHCGFATAYSYAMTASVLKSFILTHSPDYLKSTKPKFISINPESNFLNMGEQIIGYWWSQNLDKSKTLDLNFEIYGADDSLCPDYNAFEESSICRRKAKIEISEEAFENFGFIKAQNQVENEVFIRELNSRTSLHFQHKTIVGTSNMPDQITIRF